LSDLFSGRDAGKVGSRFTAINPDAPPSTPKPVGEPDKMLAHHQYWPPRRDYEIPIPMWEDLDRCQHSHGILYIEGNWYCSMREFMACQEYLQAIALPQDKSRYNHAVRRAWAAIRPTQEDLTPFESPSEP
jgi:hypothetical protein